jgi:dolichyl-phosphate-mannose-protein mannosyltransferase
MPGLQLRAPSLVLAGLVVVAALALIVAGGGIPTPWIFIDELLHAELARSVRSGHGYSVRGHGIWVSWTYPALLAPFAGSYSAMKAVNAVVVALTAVPVYLWARRIVSPFSALAAAALTLLLPSMLFSSTLMLENLFLPLSVTACFLCALALERPTLAWQAATLLAIALAAATRVQGLLLVPVFALAALTMRRGRALAPALAVCAVVSAAVVAKLAAGGLGVYEAHRDAHYSAVGILGWLVRSAGELSLAAGILPVAALLALRPRTERERAFVAVTAWATAALVCLAAVAAAWQPLGIKERYMAGALPLLMIALVLWLERGARPRPLWAVAVPAALAAALPLGRLFRNPSLLGNAWGLLPFERAGLTAARILLLAGAASAVAVYLWAPRVGAVGVALFLALSTVVVYSTIRGQSRTVLAASGIVDRRWIDAAATGPVTYLNATAYEQETREGRWFEEWLPVWTSEFWNRRFAGVLTLSNASEPAPFFQRQATLDWSDGTIGGPGGYVLADPRFRPAGRELASNARLVLYHASTPLRLASAVEGVHADGTTTGLAVYDGWAGPKRVTVTTTAPGTLRWGSLVPAPGAGASIGSHLRRAAIDGTRTLDLGTFPVRIEVAVAPGSRVSFRAA